MSITNTHSLKSRAISLAMMTTKFSASLAFLILAHLPPGIVVLFASPQTVPYYYAFVLLLMAFASFHAAFFIRSPSLYLQSKIWRYYSLPQQLFGGMSVVLFAAFVYLLPKFVDLSSDALTKEFSIETQSIDTVVLVFFASAILTTMLGSFLCGFLVSALNLDHKTTRQNEVLCSFVATLMLMAATNIDGLLHPQLFLSITHLIVFDVTRKLAPAFAGKAREAIQDTTLLDDFEA